MAKRNDSLRRRRPFREVKRRILIVCEGEVTEPNYFNDLRHQTRSLVGLKIEPGGTPKTLVERAADLKKSAEKDAKRGKDETLKYDVVWCVFDVDEHPFFGRSSATGPRQWHRSSRFESVLRALGAAAFSRPARSYRPTRGSAAMQALYATV